MSYFPALRFILSDEPLFRFANGYYIYLDNSGDCRQCFDLDGNRKSVIVRGGVPGVIYESL